MVLRQGIVHLRDQHGSHDRGLRPRMVEQGGFTLDEAVSLMGAVLPHLTRWRDGEKAEG